MLNVRVKKALLTILTACLTVLMTIGAVLGFAPTPQTVKATTAGNYVKVTSAPADWSGDYLIVYEAGNVAFNGSLDTLDAVSNTVSVTINDGKIEATDATKAASFVIAKSGSNYTIKSTSDKYIGQSSNANGLKTDKAYANTISLNSDKSVNLVSGGAYLRYNATAGQYRFRYYKSSSYTGQKAICLYKLEEASSGDTEDTPCEHVNKYEEYDNTTPGTHSLKIVCPDCNTVLEQSEAVDCYTESWSAWNTENGQHNRTGKCDTCKAEMTESGACEVSNGTYESVSDTQHKLIGTCDTCGNPTEISATCVYNKTNDDDNGVTYECDDCPNTYINPKYTITFHVPAGINSVEELRVEKGATEVLPEADTDADGKYTFAGWTSEASWNDTTSPAIYASYTMGEENVDLYALYTYTEGSTETGYVKVTAANQLAVNDTIVIAANGSNVALGADRGNNRSAAAITKDGDTIEFEEDAGVVLITLEEGKVEGTFAFSTDTGYLYAASSGSNQLKTKATLDVHGSWKIEINNGVATIKAPESSNRSWVRYNSTNNPPIFSCYSSGQADVCIYKLVSGTTHYLTDIGPKIASASLTLGEELTMNYKVAMDDDIAEDAVMTFTLAGNTTTVTGTKVDGLYVYSLQVAPQFMGANIAAELKLGETVLASKAEYSVKAYAEYLLNNEKSSNEVKQLASDLLHYGAAAQMYKDYDTDNLVNADIAANENAPTSTDFTLVANPDVENGYPVYFTGANLNFSSLNTLYVKLSSYDEKVELYVNDEKVELTGTTYSTGGLKATQFNDTFTFVLKYDGIEMQTLTYSVNAYAYQFGQAGKEGAMADLARALYNYGVSTEAYVASLGNQA